MMLMYHYVKPSSEILDSFSDESTSTPERAEVLLRTRNVSMLSSVSKSAQFRQPVLSSVRDLEETPTEESKLEVT